jgi:hypothetical protein
MPSSTAVRQRNAAGAKLRKKSTAGNRTGRGGWKSLWPLLVCIVITPFAVRSASILALEGPKALALLYPWVEVVRSPALHVPADLLGPLSQWIIFLQFPLYGMLMWLTFRADRHLRAFIIGLAAHFTGLLSVVLLAWLSQ